MKGIKSFKTQWNLFDVLGLEANCYGSYEQVEVQQNIGVRIVCTDITAQHLIDLLNH
jgi:hypothetical protein